MRNINQQLQQLYPKDQSLAYLNNHNPHRPNLMPKEFHKLGAGAIYGAAQPAVFSPLDISDIVAWYNPDDSATITKAANRVSQMDDKSGNGFHQKQATGGLQPLSDGTTQNGLEVIDFAGSRTMETDAFTELSQPFTIAFAGFIINVGNGDDSYAYDGIAVNKRFNFGKLGFSDSDNFFRGSPNDTFTATGVRNAWRRIVNIHDGVSGVTRSDGVQKDTGNSGSDGVTGIKLQANYLEGVNNFFSAKLGEFIVYNKVVSGAELTDLEDYLTRWIP